MAKIGEIKLKTSNGIVTLPVYEPSDAGSNIYDVVRVKTENGVGIIPFADPQDAAYQYLKLKTQNNGIIAAHDSGTTSSGINLEIDGFENGNYTNNPDWTSGSAEGSTSNIYVGNERVREGSYALQMTNTSGSVGLNKSLDRSPQDGDVLEGWFNIDSGSDDTYYGIITQAGSEPFGGEECVINFNNSEGQVTFWSASGDGDPNTGIYWDNRGWLKVEAELDLPNQSMHVEVFNENYESIGSYTGYAGWDLSTANYLYIGGREKSSRASVDKLAYF